MPLGREAHKQRLKFINLKFCFLLPIKSLRCLAEKGKRAKAKCYHEQWGNSPVKRMPSALPSVCPSSPCGEMQEGLTRMESSSDLSEATPACLSRWGGLTRPYRNGRIQQWLSDLLSLGFELLQPQLSSFDWGVCTCVSACVHARV